MKKKTILVINPKGGSGKTTFSTNLASYYAVWDIPVAIADYDTQQSAKFWIQSRPEHSREIKLVKRIETLKGDRYFKRIIIDAPAKTTNLQSARLIQAADNIIIPVLPSPIDIHAVENFITQVVLKFSKKKLSNTAFVANRCKLNTLAYQDLFSYLESQKIGLITSLRDTQQYSKAFENGLGIFELPASYVETDLDHWRPIIDWIESD